MQNPLEKFLYFCSEVNKLSPDAVVLTGDITEAPHLKEHMRLLESHIQSKIYYVLGNHDFYRGRISSVREMIGRELQSDKLCYLSCDGSVPLNNDTCVIGHDGWYDGQYSNWFAPHVVRMCDYMLIGEFNDKYLDYSAMPSNPEIKIFGEMQRLAKQCADHIKTTIPEACKKYKNIVFATHVPPWKENSLYKGKISNSSWLPNFSSKLTGDALLEVARDHPDNNFTVLCGHSHTRAEFHPLPNMVSYTAKSEYNEPWLSIKLLELE